MLPPPLHNRRPSVLEDSPKNFFHSNFRFFPAKICENLKIFDEHTRRPGIFYYGGGGVTIQLNTSSNRISSVGHKFPVSILLLNLYFYTLIKFFSAKIIIKMVI
jgi:hypothetical protein